MRLLDDNPTDEDLLGFSAHADLLFQVITGTTRLPLTVGIFGSWGSGKTSLMRTVEAKLRHEKVKTVWFNAWKYDGKEAIWNALIQTIFYEMKSDPDVARSSRRAAFRRRVVRASKELAKYSAKVGTRFVPGGIVREEDVDAVLEALGSSADDRLFEFVNKFEFMFDSLVKDYVGEKGFLVVFIDDLDRCLPENAIEVMEALKLYLDRANCIFVLGVEPTIVEEAIKRRYNDSASLSATEYIEKIIQIPFVLPRPRTDMLLALSSASGATAVPKQSKRMGTLIRAGTNRNPRRVKRFLNAFSLAAQTDGGRLSREEKLSLAKVLLIQMRFPRFYGALVDDPGLITKVSGKPESAWEDAGVGELREDVRLVQFLSQTSDVAAQVEDVRRWIRAAVPAEPASEVDANEVDAN
jgi:KAP family P-loop domain